MENLKNLSESIICSGSDMNRRTFRDDESWNSLQSTILAANFSLSQDSSQQDGYNNLTTLSEKSASKDELEFKSVDEDDNVLNVNLDAISDEVFFDCQNVSAEFQFPTRKESASEVLQVPGIKEFLTTESPSSGNNASTVDSGVEEERTGALLVQIVEDFKDMKDHAQSTPKHLSPTTNLSKNLRIKSALNNNNNVNKINNNNNDDDVANNNNNNNNNNNKWNNKRNNAIGAAVSLKNMTNVNGEVKSILGKKTLSCLAAKVIKRLRSPTYDQHSPVDKTNKENFFAGKYSSAVSAAHKPDANLPSSQPDKKPAPRKVAEMKEFFENKSKIYEQSRNRQIESRIPVRKGVGLKPILVNTKSPQLRNPRNARSPSYHTQETFKLLRSSKAFKMNNNNGGTSSFYLRNNTRTRPTSCSEFTPDASTRSAVSRNTSKSTNDLSRNDIKHSQLLYATERKMINKRSYVPHVNQCTTLNPKSPLSSLKVSDIMKRKSLGYVSSPVKPVKELRKIFSPGGGPNAKKRSHKKTPGIKIVISNE